MNQNTRASGKSLLYKRMQEAFSYSSKSTDFKSSTLKIMRGGHQNMTGDKTHDVD